MKTMTGWLPPPQGGVRYMVGLATLRHPMIDALGYFNPKAMWDAALSWPMTFYTSAIAYVVAIIVASRK